MEKYIFLVLGVLSMVGAVTLAVYGVFADCLHVSGEGVMYGFIALILIHCYNEAKKKEEDGI